MKLAQQLGLFISKGRPLIDYAQQPLIWVPRIQVVATTYCFPPRAQTPDGITNLNDHTRLSLQQTMHCRIKCVYKSSMSMVHTALRAPMPCGIASFRLNVDRLTT